MALDSTLLLAVGVLVAAFVGFNIGGSNTGVAFGPAVGSRAISKLGAGALMTVFALLGGWTIGRRVVTTLGSDLVAGDPFTMTASIGVLFFVGFALLISNLFGVPASTSMTAVGAIAGLGLATGRLNTGVIMGIVSWWLIAPVVGFWVSGVVGRYAYDAIDAYVAIDRTRGPTFALATDGGVPRPGLGPNTTPREAAGTILVVVIACYMAFSAGASNVANAVAPLVGNGAVSMTQGVLLAAGAIGLGALTIARRTLETMGNDLTTLPLTAALVVAVVSASLVTVLSALGVPASFVVIATMCIVGLGWGRATQTESEFPDPAGVDLSPSGRTPQMDVSDGRSVGTGTRNASAGFDGRDGAETESEASETTTDPGARTVSGSAPPPRDGSGDARVAPTGESATTAADLYRPMETARVLFFQNVVPGIATAASYLLFRFVPL